MEITAELKQLILNRIPLCNDIDIHLELIPPNTFTP